MIHDPSISFTGFVLDCRLKVVDLHVNLQHITFSIRFRIQSTYNTLVIDVVALFCITPDLQYSSKLDTNNLIPK